MWRWWLLATILGIALGALALGVQFLLAPEKLVAPSGEEYGSSLAGKAGEGGGECNRRGGGWYLCGVETDSYSGIGAEFRLTPTGDGCWSARSVRVKRRQGGDRGRVMVTNAQRLDGCVSARDYVLPNDISDPGMD
jgi:hypothetical protein